MLSQGALAIRALTPHMHAHSLKKRRLAQWSAASDEGKGGEGVPTPIVTHSSVDPSKCRLFIGNLPHGATQGRILKFIQEAVMIQREWEAGRHAWGVVRGVGVGEAVGSCCLRVEGCGILNNKFVGLRVVIEGLYLEGRVW